LNVTDGTADLCILILSYNRPEYLRQAVRSVLAQKVRPQRIIVLDNGSTASVKEHLTEELAQGVEWFGAENTHPSIWNFRRAVSMAEGRYFMMMHDDDRLLPEFTEQTLRFLDEHPDVIAVACNAYVIDDDGNRMKGRLCREERNPEKIFLDQGDLVLHYSRSFLPFPSLVYRNGFPQKVPMREEYGKVGDSLFLCQLAEHGKMAYLDQALFEYRVHSGQDSSTWPFEEIRHRDDMLMDMVKGDGRRLNAVRRNLSRFETKQAIMSVMAALMTSGSFRNTVNKMTEVRSPMFNPLLIPLIFLEERRNIVLLSKRLRRSFT
jgi:glycosyltransferase involved in cell wall biosynthesis